LELYMKGPVPVKYASALPDEKIKELGDRSGETLAKVREIIHEVDLEIVEDWTWMGLSSGPTAASSAREGRTGTSSKMTLPKGAALMDASGLFNSSLDGNDRRAIDIQEGDKSMKRP
jgi:hypothetical protein